MSAISPEMQNKIAIWRSRAIDGTLSEADLVEGIKALRADRYGAATASDTAKRKAAKAVVPDADDLLKELGDLGDMP